MTTDYERPMSERLKLVSDGIGLASIHLDGRRLSINDIYGMLAATLPPASSGAGGEPDPDDLVAALKSADGSGVSIGNKLLTAAAINALSALDTTPEPRGCPTPGAGVAEAGRILIEAAMSRHLRYGCDGGAVNEARRQVLDALLDSACSDLEAARSLAADAQQGGRLESLEDRRWRLLNYAPQGSCEEGRYRDELAKIDREIAALSRPADGAAS